MENLRTLKLDGRSLTLEDVEAVAHGRAVPFLDPQARQRIASNHELVRHLVDAPESYYGINTGFGVFVDRRIDAAQAARLSRNLVLSHAVGTGSPFPPDVVRAAILIRANTLAHGNSGVRPVLIETLVEMLRRDVVPVIPSQGSLGSSGDLAPLAHLALVLSKDPEGEDTSASGEAWHAGERLSGTEAMQRAGLARIVLAPKEGLALTNGATFATALLALSIQEATPLLRVAQLAAAMSIEALMGVSAALDERIHAARLHPGQMQVAAQLRQLLAGSTLMDRAGRVQDAYSLRCTPQVLGPALEILDFVRQVAAREINAVTDNPLIFGEDVLSGGNFHGEPIGLACDHLKIALAEVGAIAERRIYRLLSGHTSGGLPPMLVPDAEHAGLESGLMMLQYTAASLVLENKSLASPDSIHSLPTSAGQEDHNANATTAARHLRLLLQNLHQILSIELLCAARALQLRLRQVPEAQLGKGTTPAFDLICSVAPMQDHDHVLTSELAAVDALIRRGDLLAAAAVL